MQTSSPREQISFYSAEWSYERLDSWKEIAAFFRREVRTVQLWEKKEGLPIRRQQHAKLGSVFAFRRELEEWWIGRSAADPRYAGPAPEQTAFGLVPDSPFAVKNPSITRRILSLPFELVSQQPDRSSMRQSVAYFGEGLRAELNVELGRLHLHPLALPAKALPSPGTNSVCYLRTIAREFNVGFLLTGTLSYCRERVKIIVQIIVGSDLRCVWSDRFECDLLSDRSEVAARIAREASVHIQCNRLPLLEKDSLDSRLALNAYGMGLHFWGQRSRKTLYKSIVYLEDAVELNPECADAYAALADAYVSLSYHYLMSPSQAGLKANDAVRRALLLEPHSLRVRNAYINVLLNCHLDGKSAERECEALVDASKADGRTLELYSILLGSKGRHGDSIRRALQVCELAPDSHAAMVQLGCAYFFGNQHENARLCFQRAIEIKPQSIMNHAMLCRVEGVLGNWNGVLAASERTASLSENSLLSRALLAYAYVGLEEIEQADRLLNELEERRQDPCYPAYEIATVYALLNRGERALESLARACDLGDMKTIFMAHDPGLTKLRQLPGFTRMVASSKVA